MKPHTIGIISDTHNVLPNEVFDLFNDVDQIIHAGDIGGEDLLTALGTIAPVVAVYGNMDRMDVVKRLKERLDFVLFGFRFVVTHIPTTIASDDGPSIRIHGHTHKPVILEKGQSFVINPGSASQPRGLPERSVAILVITAPGKANAQITYF